MPKGIYPRRVKRHAVTQPQDPSYRLIPLTRNQNAIVDAEDFEWLSQWNWHAHWSPSTRSFYAQRTQKKLGVTWMAREVLHCQSNERVDHIHHNTLDNRKKYLRRCTHAQNCANARTHAKSKSGFKGVNWNKQHRAWRARITVKGVQIYLGKFNSKEEAARSYDAAAIEHFGDYAVLNFPS